MAPGTSMPDTVPVTVLAGPLPAAWRDRPGWAKTAVLSAPAVVNPFQRAGGCACCAPNGGLTRAMRGLVAKARRGEIDRVVIESAADPRHVRAALENDPVLASVFHIDRTVPAAPEI